MLQPWCRSSGALLGMAVGVIAFAAGARAQPVTIFNHGFEANFAAPNSFPVLVPTGWQLYDPAGIVDQTVDAVGVLNPTGGTFFPAAPDGSNVALIYLSGDVGGGVVGLRQNLAAVMQVNTRYTLRVEVGNIASGFGAPPFNSFYNLAGFPGYQVQLLAGGQVVAQDNNTLAPVIPEGQFRLSTVVFDALPGDPRLGQQLAVRLINLNIPGTPIAPGIEVDFDFVRLDRSPVPTACNSADIAAVGGTAEAPGDPDVQLTVDDIIVFVNLFGDATGCPGAAPCSRADVTDIGDTGTGPDGQLTVDDIIAFFNAFGDGC